MLTLYDNAFSPFARKVRMALEYKGLEFEVIDGLRADGQASLARVNPRREVPVLVDGDLTVVNSSHILQYLEEAYPQRPLLPAGLAARVRARHWERISDSLLDAILLNVSLWMWAERADKRPPAMEARARADLESLYDALERELSSAGDYIVGTVSVADLALFPHLRSVPSAGDGEADIEAGDAEGLGGRERFVRQRGAEIFREPRELALCERYEVIDVIRGHAWP